MKTIILLLSVALALPLFSANKSPLVKHLDAGEKLTIVSPSIGSALGLSTKAK